jgi:cytidylate kinase
MFKVIAIDGPSGVGKSTISKLIAERLGFVYLDTGSFYRAVALYLLRKGLGDKCTDDEIKKELIGVDITFKDGRVYLKEGVGSEEDVTDKIRTPEVGHYASLFSAKKIIRDFLFNVQREVAKMNNVVAEGRDMTTVVFPDAWRKFYLDASLDIRVKRRFFQLRGQGMEVTIGDALRDVKERDIRDSSRDIAPLMKAEDAIYIDTTNLSIEEVIQKMLRFICLDNEMPL